MEVLHKNYISTHVFDIIMIIQKLTRHSIPFFTNIFTEILLKWKYLIAYEGVNKPSLSDLFGKCQADT